MKSVGKIFVILLALVLTVLFSRICIDEAVDATKVFKTKNTCVELEATISSYNERTETDEGYESVYYEQYVSYEYNGEKYSCVRYDSTYSEPELGKKVKVKIDPENPGELLADNVEMSIMLVMIPVFLTAVTFSVYFFSKSAVDVILRKLKINSGHAPAVVAIIVVGCKVIGESIFYYLKYDSIVFAAFSLAAVAAILIIHFIFGAKDPKCKSVKENPEFQTVNGEH